MSRMSATDRPESPPGVRPPAARTARGRRLVAHRQHAAGAAAPHRAAPGRRDPRQARVAQPGRIGEGPRRRLDDPRGPAHAARCVPGKTLLDASSGNTGIALAMLGAALGYPGQAVRAVERLDRAQAAARRLRRRRRLDQPARRIGRRHPRGAAPVRARARRATSTPTSTATTANWRAHFETTAVEILAQTSRRITHFVAGLGTSGTFMGTGRRLRQEKPDVRLISVQPDGAVPRPRRPEAHGVGDRPADLRPDARRRSGRRRHRRGVGDGAAPGARGRRLRRRLRRRGAGRDAARRRGRRTRRLRHDHSRQRRALPVGAPDGARHDRRRRRPVRRGADA